MERLYRGVREGQENVVGEGLTYYTPDLKAAEYYADGGRIIHIDVPSEVANSFQTKPTTSDLITAAQEYIVPEKYAKQWQEFRPPPPKDLDAKMREAISRKAAPPPQSRQCTGVS
jgi:hypothetical protein